MKTCGVAVLGYGFMGRTHTFAHKAIPFYYTPQPLDCQLKVVCEVNEQLARAACREGGFQRWTTDPMEAIRADDVQIVHICTPNQHHLPALSAAIRAGKQIYVDKPVTARLQEADELSALLDGYRGVAQVALQYRFFPATIRAKQLIDDGFAGPLTHFRGAYLHSGSVDPNKPVNWKSTAAGGGGVIRDLGSHVIDLLLWLIGPMSGVCCASRIWSARRPSLDEPGKMIDIDAEDAAVMLLRREDGTIGAVEASKVATGTEDELRVEIHGRDGAMRFNLMQPNYLEVYDCRAPDGVFGGGRGWQQLACVNKYPPPGGKFPNPKFSIGWIRSHIHSLYAFLAAVAEGRPASPSLAEGIHLQRVLEAVRESARTGKWTELPK